MSARILLAYGVQRIYRANPSSLERLLGDCSESAQPEADAQASG